MRESKTAFRYNSKQDGFNVLLDREEVEIGAYGSYDTNSYFRFPIGVTFGYPDREIQSLANLEPAIHIISFDYNTISFYKEEIKNPYNSRAEDRIGYSERTVIGSEGLLPLLGMQDFEFYDIRDQTPAFEFAFFPFEAIRTISEFSNYVYLSGAYIRPGTKYLTSIEYEDKAYFTFKLEGDMALFNEDILNEKIESGFVSRNEINEVLLAEDGRSYQANAVLGYPCPPVWETFRVIESTILFKLDKIGGNIDANRILFPIPDTDEQQVNIRDLQGNLISFIRLNEYRELIKFSWRRFVKQYKS